MKNRFHLFVLVLFTAVYMPYLALAQGSREPVYGGSLVMAVSADVDGLDPHKTVAAATFQITRNIFDTLVEVDPKGRILPDLASSWDVSSNGLRWTFRLHGNVLFHNGRRATSADVKYTFERILDKATAAPRAADYAAVKSMETPDENTIVFILGQSYAPFLSNLAVGWAAIVPKEAVERGNFRSNPVGTGPFKFAEWVPDSHVRLVKFTDYFRKGMPYLDEVTFKVIPEDTVRLVNLQTGQVDVVDSILPQKASQVDKMPGLMIVSAPSNAIQIMAVNNARPPFNDIRVRRAINYAIDKKGVIEGAQWGYGTPIGSHMSPVSEYYIDLAERYPYDPAKAKELLTEAGYPNGFKTTIALPQPYDFHIRNGEVIADQLKKVGIEAKLEIVEWASWLSNIYFGNHDYYLTTIGHTGRLDPDPFLNRYATGSRENYMSYRNPRYDELIKEGVSTADPKRRKEIYAEVQRILADDAVAVYLLAPMSLVAMRENVQGWNIYPIDIYDLRTVYKTR